MKAILIEVDFATGKRAGDIDPRKPGFPCAPEWQDIEGGRELRIVLDGNVERFRGQPGVTILETDAEIDAAVASIEAAKPEAYAISHEALAVESIRQKRVDISDLSSDLDETALAKALYERGVLGVFKPKHPERLTAAKMKKRYGLQ